MKITNLLLLAEQPSVLRGGRLHHVPIGNMMPVVAERRAEKEICGIRL